MNWNYAELAEMLSMGRIDVDRAAFPYMLDEARKRRDGDVIADIASNYYEDVDESRYIELVSEAAGLGSEKANFWMGWMYQSGKKLPRDYEKAYQHFLKSEEYDWVPINPEDNLEFMEQDGGEVVIDSLLNYGDIGWWLFLLEKHPNRAVKCGLADWYMKQDGEENRAKALKLFEESANEGFEYAFFTLIKFYAEGEFKDIDKGRYWFEKAIEYGFDEACFADALGVESLLCRKLKVAADSGDCVAAAKLACAYLHGEYGEYELGNCVCCPKDEVKARHYGRLACAEEKGLGVLIDGLDNNKVEERRFLSEVTG